MGATSVVCVGGIDVALLSVESKKQRLFVSYAVDITDK
jgi:hypothetical protein